MAITQGLVQGLFSAFDTTFSQAYEGTPTWIDKIASKKPSSSRRNVYAWLQRVPALTKWVGPRTIKALATYLYSLDNAKFQDGISIQREDIEDDIHGMFGPALQMLGEASKKWPDQQMAATIEKGDSTVVYDGANFFDASHPVNKYDGSVKSRAGTTTQSNLLGSKPLTPDNFTTAYQTMRGFVGEDGKPLGALPDTLIVPPELEIVAENIVKASFIAPQTVGGNTQVGANENVLKGKCEVLVIPELTSTTSWYLACTKRAIRPFIFQERIAPDLVPLVNPTDPNVVNLDEFQWVVRARGAFGFGLWWLALKCTA